MDSALHILSGCQCPVICNMVPERHNIASRMILKVVSKPPYRPNLVHMKERKSKVYALERALREEPVREIVHMDVGSADRLAQHVLHITEQGSHCVKPLRYGVHTFLTPAFLIKLDAPPAARCYLGHSLPC
eukprot:918445-Pelagomonas_calceolata.AAC.1